jgi:hypothetical protein
MLEILFLSWFVRKLSAMAKSKGRSGSWGGLGAAFWIGGEILGFVVGTMADADAGSYLIALIFAGIGAGIAYAIVSSLGGESAQPMTSGGEAIVYGPPEDPNNPYNPPRTG